MCSCLLQCTLTHTHTHTHTHTQIQKQVHPRLDIEDGAIEYLEMLIYQLLAQMCAAQPKTMQDVETNVMGSFAHPINLWCLRDAQEKMERYAVRKRGVFIFPMEKLFQQLQKVQLHSLHQPFYNSF